MTAGGELVPRFAWRSGAVFGPLLFQVGSSAATLLVPVGLLVGIVHGVQSGFGFGEWDGSLLVAGNNAMYVEVAAGLAAVMDARSARRRVPEMATTSRTVTPHWAGVLGAASLGVAADLVLCGIALAGTAAISAFRWPNLLLVAVQVAWIVAAAGLGWLAGWWLPVYVALPTMILIGWLAFAVLANYDDAWPALFTGMDNGIFGTGGLIPRSPVLAAQVGYFSATAAICVLATSWRRPVVRRASARLATVVVVAVAIASATFVVVVDGPSRRTVTSTLSARRCVTVDLGSESGTATVCARPDTAGLLPVAGADVRAMWSVLSTNGVPVPSGLVDAGLRHSKHDAVADFSNRDRASIDDSIAQALLTWSWCRAAGVADTDEYAATAVTQRQLWLLATVEPGIEPYFDSQTKAVGRWPIAEQVHWVTRRPAGVTCRG